MELLRTAHIRLRLIHLASFSLKLLRICAIHFYLCSIMCSVMAHIIPMWIVVEYNGHRYMSTTSMKNTFIRSQRRSDDNNKKIGLRCYI